MNILRQLKQTKIIVESSFSWSSQNIGSNILCCEIYQSFSFNIIKIYVSKKSHNYEQLNR